MALIIEDGTIVSDANSYATVLEVRAFALTRGITLPISDTEVEVMLVKAGDYLNSIENFRGEAVEFEQSMNWPRVNVVIGLNAVSSDAIPNSIKKAQMQLVLHIADGIDLNPVTTGNFIKREKIGQIETEYSETLNTDLAPSLPLVDALLAPFISPLKSSSSKFSFLPVTRA